MWDQKRSASEVFVDLVAASAAGEQGEKPRCPPVAAARKQAAGQGWTPVGSLRPDPCRLSRRQRFPNGRTQPTRPANSQPPNWASCSKSWRDNLFDILVYENIWKYCNTLVATEAKKNSSCENRPETVMHINRKKLRFRTILHLAEFALIIFSQLKIPQPTERKVPTMSSSSTVTCSSETPGHCVKNKIVIVLRNVRCSDQYQWHGRGDAKKLKHVTTY